MHFVGLAAPQLLALFGLAGAVVVALYILKLRRRPVAVPFSPLWGRVLRDKEASSLFSRLKRLLSLLLQLLLVALLVLALGDPRTAAPVVAGRTLVVLVDTSASMGAREAPTGRSRLELAKEQLKTLVRGLGASDRVLIASVDAVVTPQTPMSSDVARLEAAIETLRPADCGIDLSRGLRFALDTLRGSPQPEVVLVSDGQLPEARDAFGVVSLEGVKLSFVPVGTTRRNLGITQFAVRRYPLDRARYEVMIELQNLGDHDEDVELSLYGDSVLVDLTKLHIRQGERLPRFYPSLGGASRTLEAKLAVAPPPNAPPPNAASAPAISADRAGDALAADDHAFAVLPERRRTRVLAVSEGNTYLAAALLLDEYLEVTSATKDDFAAKIAEGHFDVAIFDGVAPALRPGLPALYLDYREGGPLAVAKAQNADVLLKEPGFDTLLRKHPILRWTALENVGIEVSRKLIPGEGDKVVGASVQGPLLVAGSRQGTKFVAAGFDVRRTDLPLRIAWPVLLLNSINWFVEEDSEYLSSFKTGEVWHVPAPLGATTEAWLTDPDGVQRRVPIEDGRAVYFGTRAGIYRLAAAASASPFAAPPASAAPTAAGAGNATRDVMFAANLVDAQESQITPHPDLLVDGHKGTPVEGFHVGVRQEIWIYLLLIVAAITALEWATYHRRITV